MPTDEILTIEKLVYGGEGLARQNGRVVLIPHVLPGEVVRAEIDRSKSDLFRGRVLELIEPSASRVEAPCLYFPRCGGCQYQHIDYATQVEQKRAILQEVLARVGKIQLDSEIGVVTGDPWQYRNRIQLHIKGGQLGYFEHGSHILCPVDHCPIASPALNEATAKLAAEVPACSAAVELFTNETEVQVNVLERVPRSALAALQSLGVSGPIEYAGFRVSRNSFFQVNRFLIDRLIECAIGDAKGGIALDLYAGVGLFAASLAERFQHVTAVESSRGAFQDLEYNINRRGLQIVAENKTAEEFLTAHEGQPDLILADPPRSGLGRHVVRELNRIRAHHLTIVSCDPATLARDLRALVAEGYCIEDVTMIDLFPQTFHIETVVHLSAAKQTRALAHDELGEIEQDCETKQSRPEPQNSGL